jgi:peptidoglycan hydrolase FlgJ
MQLSGIGTAPPTSTPDKIAKATRAAHEFEGMFAAQILSPMWEGMEVNETFGGGHGEEVFRTMLLQEYGKAIANSGSLGLANHVKQAMLKTQEV